MVNEIAKNNIFESISDKLHKYLDVKDSVFENDYVEVLGDFVSAFKIFKNASALIVKKKFQSFLKGFNGADKPSKYQLQKLYDYIDNEVKAEFIADIFSKVLLSNSKWACVIMGSISQKLIENDEEILHDDLVCAEAITKFFDYDIRNYKMICEYLEFYMKERIKVSPKGFEINYALNRFCIEKAGLNSESVDLTLEKAIAYQLFYKESEVDLDVDESSVSTTEMCYITKPGEQVYKYILNLDVL